MKASRRPIAFETSIVPQGERMATTEQQIRPGVEAHSMQESRQLMHTMWLDVLRRYLAFVLVWNLLWEFAQLPLYTIWHHGTPGEMAFAALHCTAGDALIASASLLIALMMFGQSNWPSMRYLAVAAAAMAFGLAYTIFSEWLHTSVR